MAPVVFQQSAAPEWFHHAVKIALGFETDARNRRQAYVAILHRNFVGEPAERLEHVRIGFVTAKTQTGDDVGKREIRWISRCRRSWWGYRPNLVLLQQVGDIDRTDDSNRNVSPRNCQRSFPAAAKGNGVDPQVSGILLQQDSQESAIRSRGGGADGNRAFLPELHQIRERTDFGIVGDDQPIRIASSDSLDVGEFIQIPSRCP